MRDQASSVTALWNDLRVGHATRRDILKTGVSLGLTAPALAALLAACGGSSSSSTATLAATAKTGGASPTSAAPPATTTGAGASPTAASKATATTGTSASPTTAATSATASTQGHTGTPGHGRGKGDLLRILYWQTATNLNPHFSQGNNNSAPLKLVLESLLEVDPDGNLVPVLVEQVPTLENGGLAKDGKSVTYTLKQGLVWSDGTPFTTDDAIFTWKWATGKNTNVTSILAFQNIESIEAKDERTFTIRFTTNNPVWYHPFSQGTGTGGQVLPKHLLENYQNEQAAQAPFNLKPIGTGPYKVDDFKPGDVVNYSINDKYREPDKPYFKKVEFKGGGVATAAARAVLQSGEADYALNLQVEKAILDELGKGGVGALVVVLGSNVEQIYINFADPNTEVNGAKSEPRVISSLGACGGDERDGGERSARIGAVGGGDVGGPRAAQERNGQIATGGADLRRCPGAHG